MTTKTTKPRRNSRDAAGFESTARDGSSGPDGPPGVSAPAGANPHDPLAEGAELDALHELRRVLAAKVRSAPAYTLDRLTRELRQVVRAIAELEAAAGPTSDTAAGPSASTIFAARERLVAAVVAAGADGPAAIAAAVVALPSPAAGAPIHEEMAATRRLRNVARTAAADAA